MKTIYPYLIIIGIPILILVYVKRYSWGILSVPDKFEVINGFGDTIEYYKKNGNYFENSGGTYGTNKITKKRYIIAYKKS